MAKKKTKCPTCGNLYVDLTRHKCKVKPKMKTGKKTSKKAVKRVGIKKAIADFEKALKNYTDTAKVHATLYKNTAAAKNKLNTRVTKLKKSLTAIKAATGRL